MNNSRNLRTDALEGRGCAEMKRGTTGRGEEGGVESLGFFCRRGFSVEALREEIVSALSRFGRDSKGVNTRITNIVAIEVASINGKLIRVRFFLFTN